MFKNIKNTLQFVVLALVVVQMTGCIYAGREHRRHYEEPEHRGGSFDINVHG